jgi:hypothetical protein
MQEIDLIKYQKNLQKERLYRVLKNNKKARFAFVAACLQTTGLLIPNLKNFYMFLALLTATELRYISSEIKKEVIPEDQKIINILRESSTYKECIKEYNEYIYEAAMLIRHLGFTSAKEVVAYLQKLLDNGYFSKNMNHQYQKFQYETEYVTELCGARVLTGKSVCRHTSSFFTDILNQLGYTAACIQGVSTEKDPINIATNNHRISNHAIVGVIENGQKFMYDTTIGAYLTPATGISFETPESVLISQYVTNNEKKHYLVIDPKSKILNPHRRLQIGRLSKTRIMTITKEEVDLLKTKAEIILQGNKNNQYEFFSKQEQRREKIERLYSELCPFGDTKPKKWLIRK